MAEGPKHVMGDDDTTLTGCAFENLDIWPANQLCVPGRAQAAAAHWTPCDDV